MRLKFQSQPKPNFADVINDLKLVREKKPVIHNLTNLVVMQTSANVLLAAGASPIMAHAKQELKEIVTLADALVINIGTLDEAWIKSIKLAQDYALKRRIPIIFDPVGAGATKYRTKTAKTILQNGVSILRANASEIMALSDSKVKTRGVDSKHASENAITAAKLIAKKYRCTVVISGATDIIVDNKKMMSLSHGTPLFTYVTGMGCAATALIAAFASVNEDYFSAALHAMAAFTIAGEVVAHQVKGPASFYNALIDQLFSYAHLRTEEKSIQQVILKINQS